MKTKLWTVIAATVLVGASAGYSYDPAEPQKDVSVQFLEPENYTDFRLSSFGTESERKALETELRKEIEQVAGQYLPPGYHLQLRFRDIDMAGDFEPFRSGPWQDVRILRSVYPPRMTVEYAVTDTDGNVVASGEKNLIDVNYQSKLPIRFWSNTRAEVELLQDFLRDLSRSLS